MTDRRSKGTKSRCEPRCRFRVTPGVLGNDRSVFVKECRESGILGWEEREYAKRLCRWTVSIVQG